MRRSIPNKSSNMKLTHQRMNKRYYNTPESILDWLEEELETRGIDAVVYTRYILSLLQEEDTDFSDDNCNTGITSDTSPGISNSIGFKSCCDHMIIRRQTHNCVKENIKPVTTTKWKHKRYLNSKPINNNNCINGIESGPTSGYQTCNCCGNEFCFNTDENRKLAVVECLKSASEQEFGIESFVDELCAKLKNFKLLSESDIPSPDVKELSIDCKSDTSNNTIKVSPKEQAMKYYAAFPALETDPKVDKIGVKSGDDKKCGINKKLDSSKWNGQKIIEFMTNNTGTNGSLHGLTDETSSQQTLTTTNDCPEELNRQLEALNIVNKVNFDPSLDNVINEELIKRNNTKELINSLLKNNKKIVFCDDIEKNVLSNDPLVFNNNNNESNGEDVDRFQRLVDKFNSNIASIWAQTSQAKDRKNNNIWSFDTSFSSTQSSATPSPPLNKIDFWSSTDDSKSDQIIDMTPAVESLVETNTDISWESSLLQSIGYVFNQNINEDKKENWLFSDFNLIDGIDKCPVESNTITLQNHQENSPFIEFNSLISANTKQSDCLKLTTVLPNSSLKPNSSPVEENLLISPKTHFKPIKQDSFERDSSDDGSVFDSNDREVKLVICSSKCPNNGDRKAFDEKALNTRPISTSLQELSSFMGPFSDIELTASESESITSDQEIQFNEKIFDYNMSDKSTNTDIHNDIEPKPKLEPIIECLAENEPEYQDLCNMINEVLKNGISDEESKNNTTGFSDFVSMDDWFEDESDGNEFVLKEKREKRLSWNCYWDTYDTESVNKHQKKLSDLENECKRLLLMEDISGDEIGINTSNDLFDNNVIPDDVFSREFFTGMSGVETDYDSILNCLQSSANPYNKYCLTDEIGYEFDVNGERNGYTETDIIDFDNYYWISNNTQEENDENLSTDFSQSFRLKMRDKHNDVPKRNRKPCTFFIEGNCKRSDCKYSHNISNITCKYWEDGFCFKAHLCPFLHGYYTDNCYESEESLSEFKNSYTIESESDFPSLATFTNTDEQNEDLDIEENRLEHQFFNITTRSVTDSHNTTTNGKLPIAIFMKKKVKKRKDRNLQ